MMRKNIFIRLSVLTFAVLFSTHNLRAEETLSEADAQAIAKEAYVYFYPLVIMDISRQYFTNVPAGEQFSRAPMNTFAHAPSFPPAKLQGATHHNYDTLYSTGWLDLTQEPVIISVPDTHGRYYLIQLLDMWTDTFAVVGKRTTGTHRGDYALVPPGWRGTLPRDVKRIDAPTPYVWAIGRTRTDGVEDYPAVHQIQAGYKITLLSAWADAKQGPPAHIDPSVDTKTSPVEQVRRMSAESYFAYASELLTINGAHKIDQPILARMKRLGLEAGKKFDLSQTDAVIHQALNAAPALAQKEMAAEWPKIGKIVNGWVMNTDSGVYRANYLKRATVARYEIGMNLPEDAIYPDTGGSILDGHHNYRLHFAKGSLPPVDEFWSVTVYGLQGYVVPHPSGRYTLGDRSHLQTNADGSVDIYIQNRSPGKEKEANWLPVPEQRFSLHARLYSPRAEIVDGKWTMPAVVEVPDASAP